MFNFNFDFYSSKNLTSVVVLGAMLLSGIQSPAKSQAEKPQTITLNGTVRDFSDKHPDFERNVGEKSPNGGRFDYGLDKNITETQLGSDGKPVYKGGSFSTTTKANFDQWFRNVSEVNQSKSYPVTLTKQSNGVYRYQNTNFFPINGQLIGNEGRSKNYHFTYEINTKFTYNGGEVFNFSGDDDVWVYINGTKVIELGGVHQRADANVSLDKIAQQLNLKKGQAYPLNFFFAERHTTESNFILETSLEFVPIIYAD